MSNISEYQNRPEESSIDIDDSCYYRSEFIENKFFVEDRDIFQKD